MVDLVYLDKDGVYALYVDGVRRDTFTSVEAKTVVKVLKTLNSYEKLELGVLAVIEEEE